MTRTQQAGLLVFAVVLALYVLGRLYLL